MGTFFVICGVLLVLASSATAQKPKFCTKNATKCEMAGLNITCVSPRKGSDCVKDVAVGEADLASATVDDLVKNEDKLKIVVGEKIENITENFVRYYGLAVVQKGTPFNFKELKGKKSCHTGVGKTVGWKIPVGYLLLTKEMKFTDNQYSSTADFFSESCAPGIKKINEVSQEVKTDLCSLCNGTGDDRCTAKDPYADYVGAFKCMADGNKDRVGFVKQTTADKVFAKYPMKYGNKSGYELLCKDGKRKALTEFTTCNIDKRPAHAVITNVNKPDDMVAKYGKMLTDAEIANLKSADLVTSIAESVLVYPGNNVKKYVGEYGRLYNALSAPSDAASSIVVSAALQAVAIFAVLFVFSFFN